jgi:hypothetical protein
MHRLLAILVLCACTVGPTTTDSPKPNSPDPGAPADGSPATSPAIVEQSSDAGGAKPCNTNADCGDGICEGEGCGDMEGRCAPKTGRMCTRDLRTYCGCDGKTFTGSGSCPGARFASRGECGPTLLPDGSKCLAAAECSSGICEGQGCGDDEPGTCVAKSRQCTMDLRQYCGCDGKTHQGSGSCPSLRFSKRGKC